ncbi:MAG: hypothetical protein KUL86_12625 [Castellaniella sp.]|nr:hypothetical protein [Castellaniella sp.]
MRERPILFSGPMVRAILSGQKTQTRRVAKEFAGRDDLDAILRRFPNQNGCPYGQPGDRLWVREATIKVEDHGYEGPVYVESDEGRACLDGGLAPDPDDCVEVEPYELRIRPSIHMPRSYCRIVLEIVSVRVERLQDINDADAQAEGVEGHYVEDGWYWRNYLLSDADAAVSPMLTSAEDSFRSLWESINGAGAWDTNPWVWAVEFRRITQ